LVRADFRVPPAVAALALIVSDVSAPSMQTQQDKPLALLFDMGGVVIDIDFDRAFHAWQPRSKLSFSEIKRTFRFDDLYASHERGEISAARYYDHLSSMLQIERDHDYIATGWSAIYVGEISETIAMLQIARSTLPCYAFTNTNSAHALTWRRLFPAAVACFERVFASHEIGLRKPERSAFDYVARTIGVPARSIVFFDDLAENVQGATDAGFRGVHVRSPQDVRNALRSFGCTL
jgi:FMN phosphatase YigB (HAD superfamily)